MTDLARAATIADLGRTHASRNCASPASGGLPVIFHQRDAYDDFVALLRKEFVEGMRGVIHCLTGDTARKPKHLLVSSASISGSRAC